MSTKPVAAQWWQSPFVWIGVLVIASLAVVVALSVGDGSGNADPATAETAAVTIEGPSLPAFATPDSAIGLPVPAVTAASFNGAQVQLTTDGTARIYGFFAHWCPHCQAELPRTAQWIEDNELPDGVEIVAVSTAVDAGAANYPPSEWFAREDWPATVIIDSDSSEVANSFGLTAFPYWVAVDADGAVVARLTGELDEARVAELVKSVTPNS